jgi:hypothetical protein
VGTPAAIPAAFAATPRLEFAVRGVRALRPAAVPTLAFALAIDAGDASVRSVLLDVQLQIAATRRAYAPREQELLGELFGTPERWGRTLRTLPWLRTTLVVEPFEGATVVDLEVPCSYDLEVAAARYLAALGDGDVPLELLFSGTVFHAGPGGRLQVARIGWDSEAPARLPVAIWREAMDQHFPGVAWLRLDRERFERLVAYRARHALTSWEATVDALLAGEEPA